MLGKISSEVLHIAITEGKSKGHSQCGSDQHWIFEGFDVIFVNDDVLSFLL